ncbi:MAG TPA: DinB family protein [Acidimicrobiia bacterium]|jgi:uncharacterized damage-inducible protein DinB
MPYSEADRPNPPLAADEQATLASFLDFHRATVLWKYSGLDHEQALRTVAASSLTASGIVKHLALVEDNWFQSVLLGAELPEPWASAPFEEDEDWDFHSAVDDEPADLVSLYEESCARSRAAAAGLPLEQLSVKRSRATGEPFSLRWILVHMIEETARHNGHLDLIREAVDGLTGE